MNLKKNKGYVGIDAAIAVLILIIVIPTLAGIIYNINKTNKIIDRKTEAISIAVNTMEVAKGIGYAGMSGISNNQIQTNIVSSLRTTVYPSLTTEQTFIKNSNTYKIDVEVTDYSESGKIGKNVKATVTYMIGNSKEEVVLNTIIT